MMDRQGLFRISVRVAWIKLRPGWLPGFDRVRLNRVFLDNLTNELVFVIEGDLPISPTPEGCQPPVISKEDFR